MIRLVNIGKYNVINMLALYFIVFCFSCNYINAENINSNLNNEFIKAVQNNNLSEMKKLLAKGADINYVDNSNNLCALSYAAYLNNIDITLFLIKNGANIEGNVKNPNSPIGFAILNNNVNIVELFIKSGIDPNFAWKGRGGTLLTQAVQMGKLEVVMALLRHGANVNYCGNGKHSPLFRSIIHGRNNVMEYLLNKDATLNKNDKIVLDELKWFSTEGNEKTFNLLKSKGTY